MKYPKIKKVALYGIGVIGTGWATAFSSASIAVNMYGLSQKNLDFARTCVESNFSGMVSGGLLSAQQAEDAMNLITYTTDISTALDNVQLVQESVSERIAVKEEVFRTIDNFCGPEVIVGSSSSSMLVSQLSSFSKYPERCICIHPYNPPHLIPLVELVGTPSGSDAVEHVRKFMEQIGKKPVVLKKEVHGYIGNRLQVVVGREIVEMVYRGICSVEDAETALTFGPGLRWAIMGHNLTMQLGGGTAGVKGMFEKVVSKGSDRSSYLDDLGNWIKYPDDWPEVAQDGINRAMANRPAEIGNDNDSLAAYRDLMLMEILKLHNTVKLPRKDESID